MKPSVRSRLERCDGRHVGLRRAVLQILVEEGAQDFAAEGERRVAVELQSTERASVPNLLSVMPRPEHEKDLVVLRVLRFDGLVDGDAAVYVLLIPKAVDEHHRNLQGLRGENLVNGLPLPEGVVRRMLK